MEGRVLSTGLIRANTLWLYFLILKQYIDEGVGELDDQKLPDLLNLKYQSIADAKQELGEIQTIRNAFIEFQKYLYDAKVG